MSDLIHPEEGESVSIGGIDVTFRVSGPEMNGAYALVEFRLEPGQDQSRSVRRTPSRPERR